MAVRYSWSRAFRTETETVNVETPFIDGTTSTSNGSSSAGAGVITSEPAEMLGLLVSVSRAEGRVTYLDDVVAAAQANLSTHYLYMIAERIKPGDQTFVGFPIEVLAYLKDLEVRTSKDDLLKQYYDTTLAGRNN